MAVIDSYATLQTEIANTLTRDDLTSEIPQFIQFAEDKLYRILDLRNEETAMSLDVVSGVAAVPADFKALKFAYYLDGSFANPLNWVPVEDLYRHNPDRSDVGVPTEISREATNFVFGQVAIDGATLLRGVYYAKQDPLRTTDPSWYVTNAPEVLLYGSLLEAVPFIKDDARIAVWQSFYDSGVASLTTENDNADTSRGQLVQRTA